MGTGNKGCLMGCKNLIRAVIGLGMLIAFAGCAPAQNKAATTPSPVPVTETVTAAPTEDVYATKIVNILSTYLANVTNTAAAVTPTAYPTRAVTLTIPPLPTSQDVPLTEEGPWLVFIAFDGAHLQLFVMNADGSGLKQLTQYTDKDVIKFELNPYPAPDGSYLIAYTTSPSTPDEAAMLNLLRLPDGTSQEITRLTLTEAPQSIDPDVYSYQEGSYAVLYMGGTLRWSPDGSQLAFVGAINGPTLDVYTYAPSTGEIVQLTDGPTHAWNLLWSPDGRYIVHTGNDWFSGSGSRYSDGRVWAARADGSGVTEFAGYGARYIGWLASDTLLLYRPDLLCSGGLRTVNVDSGIVYSLVQGCFDSVAYDLTTNMALIAFDDFPETIGIRNEEMPPEGPGIYLLKDGQLEFFSAEITSAVWIPEQQTFYGGIYPEYRIVEIFPETGEIVDLDAPTYSIPNVSPNGQYQSWCQTSNRYAMLMEYPATEPPIGLWIDTPDGERIQVDTGSETTGAEYVMWASDSQYIFFIDDGIGYIAAAPDFIPRRLPVDIPSHQAWHFEWLP